jgi:hypothetical protein
MNADENKHNLRFEKEFAFGRSSESGCEEGKNQAAGMNADERR